MIPYLVGCEYSQTTVLSATQKNADIWEDEKLQKELHQTVKSWAVIQIQYCNYEKTCFDNKIWDSIRSMVPENSFNKSKHLIDQLLKTAAENRKDFLLNNGLITHKSYDLIYEYLLPSIEKLGVAKAIDQFKLELNHKDLTFQEKQFFKRFFSIFKLIGYYFPKINAMQVSSQIIWGGNLTAQEKFEIQMTERAIQTVLAMAGIYTIGGAVGAVIVMVDFSYVYYNYLVYRSHDLNPSLLQEALEWFQKNVYNNGNHSNGELPWG